MEIVLVGDVYIKDNWYGTRYRIILKPDINTFFKNKTEAKKYEGKVKKYIKGKYNTTGQIYIGELIDYIYVSMGPSIYYNRVEITVNELLESIKK
jgi:hypothetical protein